MMNWFRFFGRARQLSAKVPMVTGPLAKRAFTLIPVRDPEIYPLLICVATGFTMLGIWGVHNFVMNPDISVKKLPTAERDDRTEARDYAKHRAYAATLHPNAVNTDKSFELPGAGRPSESEKMRAGEGE